jgi:hypothetical protein
MKSKQNKLFISAITLWILTLILAASVFAEKAHEGHLPERNDRGVAVLIALLGISSGLFTRTRPASLPAGKYTDWHSDNEYRIKHSSSRCSADQMMMAPGTAMPCM